MTQKVNSWAADLKRRFPGSQGLHVCWQFASGVQLTLLANLGGEALDEVSRPAGALLFAQGVRADERDRPMQLDPWAVGWWLQAG